MKNIKGVLASLLICSVIFVNSSGFLISNSSLNSIEDKTTVDGLVVRLQNDPIPSGH